MTRLGQGDENPRNVPVHLKSHENQLTFVDICNGAAHIVGLTSEGEVFTWPLVWNSKVLGKCHVGQLGHGNATCDEKFPRKIEGLKETRIAKIGCGISHILLISG